MSQKESNTPAESQEPVANIDWAALLSKEDLENLAGFFDVLIEMDLEQELKKKGSEHETKTETEGQPK